MRGGEVFGGYGYAEREDTPNAAESYGRGQRHRRRNLGRRAANANLASVRDRTQLSESSERLGPRDLLRERWHGSEPSATSPRGRRAKIPRWSGSSSGARAPDGKPSRRRLPISWPGAPPTSLDRVCIARRLEPIRLDERPRLPRTSRASAFLSIELQRSASSGRDVFASTSSSSASFSKVIPCRCRRLHDGRDLEGFPSRIRFAIGGVLNRTSRAATDRRRLGGRASGR